MSALGRTLLVTVPMAGLLPTLGASAEATVPVRVKELTGQLAAQSSADDPVVPITTAAPAPAVKSPSKQVTPPGEPAVPALMVQPGAEVMTSTSAPPLCGVGISNVTAVAALVLVMLHV